MVNSIAGRFFRPLTGNAILLTLNGRIFVVEGTWHLEDLCAVAANKELFRSGFDYLINIDGVNHLIHPDDIPAIEINLQYHFAKELSGWDFRIIGPSGHIKQVRGMGQLKSELPQLATGASVTDAESLLASKNLLEAVFNTSSLGLHVLRSVRDETGAIIDFDVVLTNATSDRIAGRKVSGMRVLEGWPHTRQIGLFDKFIDTVETGIPLTYEYLYQGDGVTAWFQWMASRFYDGLYVTIEDITKRKKDEQDIKYTADRLQSTFDGVPAIIGLLEAVTDNSGHPVDFVISAANKALSDFTGCQTQDLIGKSMTDLYPEAFRGKLSESYTTVFLTGEPLHLEFEYPGLDRWFSIFVTKQVDGKGIVAVAVEITEQKKAEEQKKQNQVLAELDQAKTEFFSNVSHEFRTPLALMLAPLNDILDKFGRQKGYEEDIPKLQIVQRNALRLQKLVNSLLDFSSIEAGRTEAIFQPVDLAEFTTLLAGNFRSAIERAGIRFSVKCESTEPIYVNQEMWEKIVLNLLSNAFKFTFEGTIEVSLKSTKTNVRLRVRDTGIGVADADLARIFQRFIRIPNAKSRTNEGTGIGLALVKEMVKMHGGNIKVKSKVGQGTQFIVSIPKGKAHLAARNIYEFKGRIGVSPLSATYGYEAMSWVPGNVYGATSTTNGRSHVDDGSDLNPRPETKTVLIVDDNADIREYVKSILSCRYLVQTAHDGERALELISSGLIPDLILADIMMPKMDGYALLAAIRKHPHLHDTPIMFLSAQASEEARVNGITRGADDYLVKPFSSVELLARVEARIRSARSRTIGAGVDPLAD